MLNTMKLSARIIAIVGLIGALCASPAQALDPSEMFADPAKEQRARDIGRSLRCLVCQNQSIFDSNAGLAKDLRVLVRERMEAGDDDQQVLDYIAFRYGDYVLLEPPVAAHTYLLWLAPILLAGIGVGALFAYHRKRETGQQTEQLSSDDRARARAILEQETQP